MRVLGITIAAFLIASFSCVAAWSDDAFSAVVTGAPMGVSGPSTWDYTLSNTSSSQDYCIWLLQIEVDESISVVTARGPTGWSASIDEQVPNLVTWFCTAGYLYPGSSLSGFQTTYSTRPVYQGWTVMFDNQSIPGDSPFKYGDVTTPEPGAAVALLTGLASAVGLVARRRN